MGSQWLGLLLPEAGIAVRYGLRQSLLVFTIGIRLLTDSFEGIVHGPLGES